ncbi:hypothetical protein Caci_1925 [Catenulispora acidiphila DSM 44928]|uniref:Uncharacterized protein n=1 Tax=Catenulispora acidiphila (strain DSM 44928 / JCM 14897 / NBRC 102108 / NRRL B-24433 / ID139908) TaxID=479433 RepID=C7QEF4_CATAD|nr:hypothetical protein [Catenulispora acidiphila]ACU70845.1 hypothetical protein Caci_1925 [Catenulispora acidiphila DSM 44928]
MVVTVIVVLIVLAALVAAYYFGPAGWRTSAAGTFGGFGTRVGKFIESGRADPRPGVGGAAATPVPPRFSEADRAYLDGVWKHVQSTFVSNPRVAVTLAHKTAEGFFAAHGVSTEGLPQGPDSADGDSEAGAAAGVEDTEAMRQRLLAIKTWSDREAAR